MKTIKLVGNLIGIGITGIVSWVASSTMPTISGMLAAVFLIWISGIFISQKFGHLTIGSVIPVDSILKLGQLPIVLMAFAGIFMVYVITTESFVLGFLATLSYFVSFNISTLAIIARNDANDKN